MPDVNYSAEPFDYTAEAELFSARGRSGRRSVGYRRFVCAADAIRFAIEELSPELLLVTFLEVGEVRFNNRAIRSLYDSADYPGTRNDAV